MLRFFHYCKMKRVHRFYCAGYLNYNTESSHIRFAWVRQKQHSKHTLAVRISITCFFYSKCNHGICVNVCTFEKYIKIETLLVLRKCSVVFAASIQYAM